MPHLVAPIGGRLIDRRVPHEEISQFMAWASSLPSVRVNDVELADLELIACGAYSPMDGFMTSVDYVSVVERAALADGTPWTLPITLSATADEAWSLPLGGSVALRGPNGDLHGSLEVVDVFARDVDCEAKNVYLTTDDAHPGVRALHSAGELLLGGPVRVLPSRGDALDPAQCRALFAEREWSSVVAFQTRNPIHRAHEYLTKVALEQVDGLFLHPLVGRTKDDDIPADVRMRCYEILLDRYYPRDRVVMSPFLAAMRYAGPREAVYHGLVRRNYGCSHFIIGRDAAGVGSYYGTYDAQHLYDELGGAARLGFVACKFEHTFYCRACQSMASLRTCPHDTDQRVILSGTRVRQLLSEGEELPTTFSRPEVAEVLRAAYALAPTMEST